MMRGQLRYLADSAQQGKTTIQVVPYRAGAHAGTAGPFVILDYEEPTDPRHGVRRDARRGHLSRGAFGREPLYPLHLTGCVPPRCTLTTPCS